jgi:hypothetical protein
VDGAGSNLEEPRRGVQDDFGVVYEGASLTTLAERLPAVLP